MTLINTASIPWIVRAYLFPDLNYFGFFPWASFLAFGMVAGSILRVVKQDDMQRDHAVDDGHRSRRSSQRLPIIFRICRTRSIPKSTSGWTARDWS